MSVDTKAIMRALKFEGGKLPAAWKTILHGMAAEVDQLREKARILENGYRQTAALWGNDKKTLEQHAEAATRINLVLNQAYSDFSRLGGL